MSPLFGVEPTGKHIHHGNGKKKHGRLRHEGAGIINAKREDGIESTSYDGRSLIKKAFTQKVKKPDLPHAESDGYQTAYSFMETKDLV